jgi:imidazolonepropionase
MIKAYTNISELVTFKGALVKDGRNLQPIDLSIIKDGAIIFDEDHILWVGSTDEMPSSFKVEQNLSLPGHVLTPELVDSHTHVVFGGDRAQEYADRLNGVSYEEIAKRGGGILFTMKETNAASDEVLFETAKERIEQIHSYGVGTIEIKSGYGLNLEKERSISLIIDRLKKHFSPRVQIFNTYLAAHDVPKDFESSSHYMNTVVLPLLTELADKNIIDAVDIFHEKNYFNDEDVKLLFDFAREHNIPRKIHADELNTNHGAEIACDYQALSADHLLRISETGIQQLSASTTIATLLPGTAFFLGKPLAPARKILDAGAKMAIASDYNPGSCHCDNVLLIAALAAAQLKLNQAELWAGLTLNAAHSLGLMNQGVLLPGKKARFSLFKAPSLSHITYHWGKNFSVNFLEGQFQS